MCNLLSLQRPRKSVHRRLRWLVRSTELVPVGPMLCSCTRSVMLTSIRGLPLR
ncbi:hypothetical protein JG687_00011402 [Phytophthora cactorum]|uniref:Uncharacterized protein n=1 Tax=Phytophthora cactorum TaxID=29920 RepID=A0A8T1U703_9STRA|nr:hypothetical protein JG687_00011402 [Phytophthora cactorum]